MKKIIIRLIVAIVIFQIVAFLFWWLFDFNSFLIMFITSLMFPFFVKEKENPDNRNDKKNEQKVLAEQQNN